MGDGVVGVVGGAGLCLSGSGCTFPARPVVWEWEGVLGVSGEGYLVCVHHYYHFSQEHTRAARARAIPAKLGREWMRWK